MRISVCFSSLFLIFLLFNCYIVVNGQMFHEVVEPRREEMPGEHRVEPTIHELPSGKIHKKSVANEPRESNGRFKKREDLVAKYKANPALAPEPRLQGYSVQQVAKQAGFNAQSYQELYNKAYEEEYVAAVNSNSRHVYHGHEELPSPESQAKSRAPGVVQRWVSWTKNAGVVQPPPATAQPQAELNEFEVDSAMISPSSPVEADSTPLINVAPAQRFHDRTRHHPAHHGGVKVDVNVNVH